MIRAVLAVTMIVLVAIWEAIKWSFEVLIGLIVMIIIVISSLFW